MLYTLQSINPNQNQKQIMHESNKLWCMLQTGIKATRIVKNENNFIDVIVAKFTMSIKDNNFIL